MCWWPVCELSDASVSVASHTQSTDGSSFIFDVTSAVTQNNADWCTPQDYTICVKSADGDAKWCAAPNTNTVTQLGSFSETNFDVYVNYTSNNGTAASAQIPFTWTPNMNTCRFNFGTSMEFTTDDLKNVNVLQTTTGSADLICGSTQYMYSHDDVTSTWSDVMTHNWPKISSVTGTKAFSTSFKFSNFPQFVM